MKKKKEVANFPTHSEDIFEGYNSKYNGKGEKSKCKKCKV